MKRLSQFGARMVGRAVAQCCQRKALAFPKEVKTVALALRKGLTVEAATAAAVATAKSATTAVTTAEVATTTVAAWAFHHQIDAGACGVRLTAWVVAGRARRWAV